MLTHCSPAAPTAGLRVLFGTSPLLNASHSLCWSDVRRTRSPERTYHLPPIPKQLGGSVVAMPDSRRRRRGTLVVKHSSHAINIGNKTPRSPHAGKALGARSPSSRTPRGHGPRSPLATRGRHQVAQTPTGARSPAATAVTPRAVSAGAARHGPVATAGVVNDVETTFGTSSDTNPIIALFRGACGGAGLQVAGRGCHDGYKTIAWDTALRYGRGKPGRRWPSIPSDDRQLSAQSTHGRWHGGD